MLKLLLAAVAGVLCLGPAAIRADEPVSVKTLTAPPPAPEKTGKERLSDKASDEQRVDNCQVPPERQGTKARPDECAHAGYNVPLN